MTEPTQNNGPYGQPAEPNAAESPYPAGHYGQAPQGGEQPGQQNATLSLVFGILGILLLPIVFGPLAVWQASVARRAGNVSGVQTAGRVTGWIGVAFAAIAVLFVLLALVGFMTTAP
ncbi:hypothetical protein [Nesterenkonia populi]|uniref:hypothetical protein n=1 Tax=Nesterenkonia populi TaxID=1591087 RepID=UPI0011BE337D|nr:hypothetical protein [Nesterenkonia populi]